MLISTMDSNDSKNSFEDMIGNSDSMKKVFHYIKKFAKTDCTILILGETGTGKELVAKALHNQSNRKDKNYIPVNCGALTRDLIESELFGHEKGSFSGAHQRHIGVIESCDQGTLFLDEIGELPGELQVKLLRVIEHKEILRIGSTVPKKVDVRFIAATHRDLEKSLKEGIFREDLYYRLTHKIELPPLRERSKDISLLVNYFIDHFNLEYSREIKNVSADALQSLEKYNWPGNVRQLINVISHCIITTDFDMIEFKNLPESISGYKLIDQQKDIYDIAQPTSSSLALNVNNQDVEEVNILFVDDDEGTRKNIVRAVKRYGFLREKIQRSPVLDANRKVNFKILDPEEIPKSGSIKEYLKNCGLLVLDIDYGPKGIDRKWENGIELFWYVYHFCPWLCNRTMWLSKHSDRLRILEYIDCAYPKLEKSEVFIGKTKDDIKNVIPYENLEIKGFRTIPYDDEVLWREITTCMITHLNQASRADVLSDNQRKSMSSFELINWKDYSKIILPYIVDKAKNHSSLTKVNDKYELKRTDFESIVSNGKTEFQKKYHLPKKNDIDHNRIENFWLEIIQNLEKNDIIMKDGNQKYNQNKARSIESFHKALLDE
jgi:DNA-binding NtrC family response regulator